MIYVIRDVWDDGHQGYCATAHEHDEAPAAWTGPTVPTIDEAKASAGAAIWWREPDADADADVEAVGRGDA